MEIKTGDIFENKNGIRIGVVEVEPEVDYVCFKIGRNITKDKLDSAHFETRDASLEGLETCLITNGYEKIPDVFTESVRLKENDAANQEEDPNAQQNTNAASGDTNTAAQPEDSGVDVDPTVDSGDQVAGAAQDQQETGDAPMKMPAAAPMPAGVGMSSEGQPLELSDGTDVNVAQDSSLQYDAIKPEGNASISFASGNFKNISQIPQVANQKIVTITRTIVPLCEAGLIELLGNNKAYKGSAFNANFNILNGEPQFEVNAEYSVESWIGTDISQQDIAEDARYLLDRLRVVPGVKWNECSIDCKSGTFKLGFII